jgi:excinuclease ABC subunit C
MSRRGRDGERRARLRRKLRTVPAAPGVYLHKSAQGKVIYVGKAKRLDLRVRHYFQEGGERDPKTDQLIRRIDDFDYLVTRSETEALVLESQLIKEYRPRYNIQLKDDKQYPYIKITLGEAFPRVLVVRRLEGDGARYFGPFTSVRDMRETLQFASGLFQIRTCHLDLPGQEQERPCLDYQIGRCSAPCSGYDTRAAYRDRVRQLVQFLEGADRRVARALEERMAALSRELRYEEAAQVRDRLRKLERTVARSRTIAGLAANLDACAVARDGGQACGVVLRIRRGKVLTTHHFILADLLERETGDFLGQLLREYYPRAGDIPPEILVSHAPPDREPWAEWLGELRGRRVSLREPRRGPKREAVAMAASNAAFRLRELERDAAVAGRRLRITPADVQLQESLGLHTVPQTIECFDISTFQGGEAVGSLVYFREGRPLKSRYRRFRIRRVEGVDDYAMMEEILDRYFGRLAERGEGPADLVIVDGGAGQLGVARRLLTRWGFHQAQLIGLAKREELIVREGGPPLRLSRGSGALQLLQRVRDEAHRFAITYHRLLRDQRTTASALDAIPGIGKVKKLSLLHHFGSVEAIRRAGGDELGRVRGLTRRDVAAILSFFEREGRR